MKRKKKMRVVMKLLGYDRNCDFDYENCKQQQWWKETEKRIDHIFLLKKDSMYKNRICVDCKNLWKYLK